MMHDGNTDGSFKCSPAYLSFDIIHTLNTSCNNYSVDKVDDFIWLFKISSVQQSSSDKTACFELQMDRNKNI